VLGQRIAIGMGVLGVAVLSGCYASTEPATDVGPETATLRAQGTANNGPARTSFEYWLTGTSESHLTTTARNWPAGASGPFTEKVSGLAAGSEYNFRVCGSDQGGSACAQTRTFTTKPAVEDGVVGSVPAGCCGKVVVDAHSTAAGANPRGLIRSYYLNGFNGSDFVGQVTCMVVEGRRAAVGAVGQTTFEDGSGPADGTRLFTVVDGHLEVDTIHMVATGGTTPPDCANASFEHQGEPIIPEGGYVVNDAQP
jgi:hypothetical protein